MNEQIISRGTDFHTSYYPANNTTLTQCRGNDGPASKTLAQRERDTESMFRVGWVTSPHE